MMSFKNNQIQCGSTHRAYTYHDNRKTLRSNAKADNYIIDLGRRIVPRNASDQLEGESSMVCNQAKTQILPHAFYINLIKLPVGTRHLP